MNDQEVAWGWLHTYLQERWGPAVEVEGGFNVVDGGRVSVHVTRDEWAAFAATSASPADEIDEMIGSRTANEGHVVFFDGRFERSVRAELPPVRGPALNAPCEAVVGGRWYAEMPDGTRHHFDESNQEDEGI